MAGATRRSTLTSGLRRLLTPEKGFCPACGTRQRFLEGAGRQSARCEGCDALERHRLMAVWLKRERPVRGARVLHVAPEAAIAELLRGEAASYVSVDLDDQRAEVQADITALPFEDGSFDVIVCCHVLEHVSDDRAALREFKRVLAEDGRLVMQHPVMFRPETFEDPSITDPAERARAFGQSDHVRLYGQDFPSRVAATGFDVEILRLRDELPARKRRRYGVDLPMPRGNADDIYVCSPRGSDAAHPG